MHNSDGWPTAETDTYTPDPHTDSLIAQWVEHGGGELVGGGVANIVLDDPSAHPRFEMAEPDGPHLMPGTSGVVLCRMAWTVQENERRWQRIVREVAGSDLDGLWDHLGVPESHVWGYLHNEAFVSSLAKYVARWQVRHAKRQSLRWWGDIGTADMDRIRRELGQWLRRQRSTADFANLQVRKLGDPVTTGNSGRHPLFHARIESVQKLAWSFGQGQPEVAEGIVSSAKQDRIVTGLTAAISSVWGDIESQIVCDVSLGSPYPKGGSVSVDRVVVSPDVFHVVLPEFEAHFEGVSLHELQALLPQLSAKALARVQPKHSRRQRVSAHHSRYVVEYAVTTALKKAALGRRGLEMSGKAFVAPGDVAVG